MDEEPPDAGPPDDAVAMARALLDPAPIPALLLRLRAPGDRPDLVARNAAARDLMGTGGMDGLLASVGAALADPAAVADGVEVALRAVDGTASATVSVRCTGLGRPGDTARPRLVVAWLQPVPAATATTPGGDLDLDPETGLPSAIAARGILARAAEHARDGRSPFSVARVDVRPPGGGSLGAERARDVARRLGELVRADDALARLDTDSFLIVLRWRVDDSLLVPFAERVRAALAPPLASDAASPGLRLGVLAAPDPTLDPDDVLGDLGRAVAAADPGATVVLGRGSRLPAAITAHSIEAALANDELTLHYQPVIDVTDGRPAGAEALVRWEHPSLGLLTPAQFLPAFDAAGGLVRLGEWVLDAAIRQVAAWDRVADLDYYRIGVNLAPRHIEVSDVPSHIDALLRRYGVSASRLIVELVESQALTERAVVARRVRELLDMGLRVAIDDFGSGFANMSYLRDLPVDVIKVDRALVALHPTARDEAILRAVVRVATAVGADVLLEGIEVPAQWSLAVRAGARFGQGLLVGPPVPAGELPPRPMQEALPLEATRPVEGTRPPQGTRPVD